MTHVTLRHARDDDAKASRRRADPEPSPDFGPTHEASSANPPCGYLAPHPAAGRAARGADLATEPGWISKTRYGSPS